MKAVHNFLMEHMEEAYTLEEMAKRFNIGLTVMKQYHKFIYGETIGEWLTSYRMMRAADMLTDRTDVSVAQVAETVRYDSASKFAAAFICMGLTFKISGKSFDIYNQSNAYMNSTIVEYIEGIEVIKAFGKAGVSYEKYAKAITDFRTFVLKWLSSTWVTMKLAFALFPSTLIGTLPVSLYLASCGKITVAEAALAVMLSLSMVGSLAVLEVYSENMRQVKMTVEELEQFLTMEELPDPKERAKVSGCDITLSDVHFAYAGEPDKVVLHGVDLNLPQGSITIGGVNVKDIPISQLSEIVSFVTQDNFLFRCSLLENIRLGNPKATDEEVKGSSKKSPVRRVHKEASIRIRYPGGRSGQAAFRR